MADSQLAKELPVARQLVMTGLVISFALLISSLLILAAVQVVTGNLVFLAIGGAGLLVIAAMIIGTVIVTMRTLQKMETAAPTEGLPALEHALAEWVEGERAALNDLELEDADGLAELELRAAWALRAADTLADLRDQRRAMPAATSEATNEESLRQLQARIAAAAEVDRAR